MQSFYRKRYEVFCLYQIQILDGKIEPRVKLLMERFEISDRGTEDPSNSRPFKIPRQDAPKGLQTRKAALEKFTDKGYTPFCPGPSTLHKLAQPKPPLAVKPSSDDKPEKDPNQPHLNPVAQRFGVQLQPTNRGNDEKAGCSKLSIKTSDPSKEDPKPLNPKPAWNKHLAPPDKEKKPLGSKPNLNFASQENEAKPEFSKVAAVKEKLRSATQENEPKPPVSKPPLAQKPSLNNEVSQKEDTSNKSDSLQRQSGPRTNIHAGQEAKEMGENNNSAAEAPGSTFPKIALKPTGLRSSLSKRTPKTVAENTEEKGMSSAKNIFLKKISEEESSSSHKFHKMNTALAAGGPSGESQEDENRTSRKPKRKILPSVASLGQPPKKPSRPPSVNLVKFWRIRQIFSKSTLFLFSSHILSWQCSFRSSRGKEKKWDKEDKRKMDQEKKEQKEKEKKEHELRKKFKLTGPIEVLHQARACVDHKGGRNELTVKQGDKIEIIRLTDNPEGKWLGRIKGCYGYIKTTMVEIDYDSLKRKRKPSTSAAVKHTESDQETYDDVGEQDSTNMFPPPPSDQDIYDGIDDEDAIARSVSQDEDKNDIWPWGILKRLKVKDGKKKSVREKTTKVNESARKSNFSLSKSGSFGKRKSDEKDEQKLKMEKEEKEFRKKFKFDGEIKVLYSTTTIQDLPQKRWRYKHLQIRPGESLDIIESTDDTKVLCRNEEGKCKFCLKTVVRIKLSESLSRMCKTSLPWFTEVYLA
uniref:SH3 domain-containing protein n=1 Tax=Zonotrichia albicollis TaxID=44394 RepID=A0A8D2MPU9_ZONAL